MNYKPYTLIGSRQTPDEFLTLMTSIALVLMKKGYTGRSGAADGCDSCLEEAYELFVGQEGHCAEAMEVFLPWRGFNGRMSKFPPYYLPQKFSQDIQDRTEEIAREIHPAWDLTRIDKDTCEEVPVVSKGAKTLHKRNIHQILGINLDTPSLFVIFWAKPKTGTQVSGGTNTGVQLGIKHNVEVFNLYFPEVRERLQKMVDNFNEE